VERCRCHCLHGQQGYCVSGVRQQRRSSCR